MTARHARWAIPAALGLVAAACSSPPTVGEAETEPEPTEDGEEAPAEVEEARLPECPLDALDAATGPVQVTFWFGGLSGAVQETLLNMVDAFNASQDAVVVNTSNQGDSFEAVARNYTSAAAANQAPDLVMFSDDELQFMVDRGEVLPAQACMEADGFDMDDIDPVLRANYTIDGVFYPGFVFGTTQVLYFNQAHWLRAGLDPEAPPQTFDEIVEQARALKEAGVSEKPFAIKLGQGLLKKWLNGLGVDLVDAGNGREALATEATFATPEARELLEALKAMDEEGLANVFSSQEGGVDQFLALANDESSMLIESSGAATTMADILAADLDPAELGDDIVDLELDDIRPAAAPLPGLESPGDTLPGGGLFYILNTAEPAQQAGAWKFVQFMLETDNLIEWHERGSYLPMRASVQDDPRLEQFWAEDVAGLMLRNSVDQLAAADPEQPGPLIGPYTEFRSTVERALEAMFFADEDIEDALADAEETVTTALQRYAG